MKLRKKDIVKVTAGKDKGKTGPVEKVFPQKNKVLVSQVNIYKKHLKPQGTDKPGGIVERSRPLPTANVALICPKCQTQTRVGFLIQKDKSKKRICRKCNQIID